MQEIPRAQAGSLLQRLWRGLGPGLVTGAADDDPSGIATHSQIGAQFGYSLSWTFVLSFPLMVVIQEVAAQIGCVTGRGIAHNLRRHYSDDVDCTQPAGRGTADCIPIDGDLGLGGDRSHGCCFSGFLHSALGGANTVLIISVGRLRSIAEGALSTSVVGPGRVKTQMLNLRVEFQSRFGRCGYQSHW